MEVTVLTKVGMIRRFLFGSAAVVSCSAVNVPVPIDVVNVFTVTSLMARVLEEDDEGSTMGGSRTMAEVGTVGIVVVTSDTSDFSMCSSPGVFVASTIGTPSSPFSKQTTEQKPSADDTISTLPSLDLKSELVSERASE